MQSKIIITKATQRDLKKIMELNRHVSVEFFKPIYQKYYTNFDLGQNPDKYIESELAMESKEYPHIIDDSDYLFFVAIVAGSIAGFIISSKKQQAVQIDLLLVNKDYRGQGVGTALIGFTYDQIKKHFSKIRIVEVYVLKENIDAINFYQRNGFVKSVMADQCRMTTYGIKFADMFYYLVRNI